MGFYLLTLNILICRLAKPTKISIGRRSRQEIIIDGVIFMRAIGIDLAGRSENPSGFCVLIEENGNNSTDTKLLYSDEEMIVEIEKVKPNCIAIDAPFWLPRGAGGLVAMWRNSEQLLIKRGFRPLSPALPTMQELSERARRLVANLRAKGYEVVETFPRAAEIILGLSKEPRKNQDEYDALLCALVAKCYLEKNFENLDGVVVPK